MYFTELTNYFKSRKSFNQAVLRIGWLAKGHLFLIGKTPTAFTEKLLNMCANPVNRTRGFHQCDFCTNPDFAVQVQQNGQEFYLGSAEIWISGKENKFYVAPNLIYHYVTEHQYHPPDEFIKAVLSAQKGLSQDEVDEICHNEDNEAAEGLRFPDTIIKFIRQLLRR